MKRMWMLVLIFVLGVLLVGCNLPGQTTLPNSDQAEQTFVAMTVAAGLTQNAPADPQPGDNQPADTQPSDPQPQPPTNTPVPTNTPEPTNTPPPTATPTETTPCNRAKFIKDVTVPDGTTFGPGDTFTKTWRLENTGSCNWNGDYELVFDSGDKMGGGTVESLSIGTIKPGEKVDISVDLKAPNTPGEYKGNWMLRSDDNEVFALGDGDVPFYVEIEVVEAVSFQVLSKSHFSCGGDTYIAVRVKNTGTERLDSFTGTYKNLDTAFQKSYIPWDNPFTENKDDCPHMGIDDIEPGDVYYLSFNMANSHDEWELDIHLCTEENGGGDCVSHKVVYDLP